MNNRLQAVMGPDGQLTLYWNRPGRVGWVKHWFFFVLAAAVGTFAAGGASPFPPSRMFDGVRSLLEKLRVLLASFSDYAELKILDHAFGDGSWTSPTAYIALWTSALTDASTGATAGEATYTGYARLIINAADMSPASAGAKTNGLVLTFAACTAGTSTITYFGILDSITVGAGNMIMWGTVTSKVIDTSNTPPTIAAAALNATLD